MKNKGVNNPLQPQYASKEKYSTTRVTKFSVSQASAPLSQSASQ